MSLIQASARAIPLVDESVQCVVTSPPYWGLRSYAGEQREVWGGEPGHAHEWGVQERVGGGKQDGEGRRWQHTGGGVNGHGAVSSESCSCGAWYGALGLEPTPEQYVTHIVEVFREVKRVLRKDGTLWLNLGDCYAAGARGMYSEDRVKDADSKQASHRAADFTAAPNRMPWGLPAKNLVGIPWLVAFALQRDGWILRSDIIWAKPNPMPESVTDRPTKSHEYLFLLTKSERYYYDHEAIKEPLESSSIQRLSQANFDNQTGGPKDYANTGTNPNRSARRALVNLKGRQMRPQVGDNPEQWAALTGRNKRDVWTIPTHPYAEAHFATFPEALVEPCILAGSAAGDRILDPFNGSGTTGAVALRLGREYVGTDLSREYLAMAERRIGAVIPVAHTVEHAARVAGTNGAQLTLGGAL